MPEDIGASNRYTDVKSLPGLNICDATIIPRMHSYLPSTTPTTPCPKTVSTTVAPTQTPCPETSEPTTVGPSLELKPDTSEPTTTQTPCSSAPVTPNPARSTETEFTYTLPHSNGTCSNADRNDDTSVSIDTESNIAETSEASTFNKTSIASVPASVLGALFVVVGGRWLAKKRLGPVRERRISADLYSLLVLTPP